MSDKLKALETGALIRRYREAAGLTQKELGRLVGLSEPAIRNFELGNRTCKTAYLERIADALGIDPSALGVAYAPDTPKRAMHILFDIAERYNASPTVLDDGTIALVMDHAKGDEALAVGMVRWAEMERLVRRGHLSEDELRLWKAGYPGRAGDRPRYSSASQAAREFLEGSDF